MITNVIKDSARTVARRKGKVGTQLGIRDGFDCIAFTSSGQFGAHISSSRLFQSDDLMSYETSLGKTPLDGSIYLPESSTSSLSLRFDITEPNNCGDPTPLRHTSVQIVRSSKLGDGSIHEEILTANDLNGNPMCAGTDFKLDISWQQVRFTCQYFGSTGTTSSLIGQGRRRQ